MKAKFYRRPGRASAIELVRFLTVAAIHAEQMRQALAGQSRKADMWLGARRAYMDAAKAAAILLLRKR